MTEFSLNNAKFKTLLLIIVLSGWQISWSAAGPAPISKDTQDQHEAQEVVSQSEPPTDGDKNKTAQEVKRLYLPSGSRNQRHWEWAFDN